MKKQLKIVSVFASLVLLTSCGAFNSGSSRTGDASSDCCKTENSAIPDCCGGEAAGSAEKPAPEKADISLGYLNSTAHLLAFVAQEEGYFKEEGLNVTLTQFSSAGELVNGLESGKLDLAFMHSPCIAVLCCLTQKQRHPLTLRQLYIKLYLDEKMFFLTIYMIICDDLQCEGGYPMKKALVFLLAAALTASLAGCGGSSGKPGTDPQSSSGAQDSAASAQDSSGAQSQSALDPLEPGKLFLYPAENGEPQVLRSVRLAGNQAGTAEFNEKDPTERVRCIFCLDEWVSVYPDTDQENGLKCWVFRHKADHAFYRDNAFSEETEGFALVCDLNRNPDDETADWGSIYLLPDECETGLYDLVFTDNGKAVGILLTRFYDEQELCTKSDDELEAMMKGILS